LQANARPQDNFRIIKPLQFRGGKAHFVTSRRSVAVLSRHLRTEIVMSRPRRPPMKLYSYWRSQATYRVRIALRLKALETDVSYLDLLKGDQFDDAYRGLNAGMTVPTLIDADGLPLIQSLAILEYLDEVYPHPPLLPSESRARAHVRALAQMVAVDVHPFIVPRVRHYLVHDLGLDDSQLGNWIRHWLDLGSRAIEQALARDPRTGRFCFGDAPTLADLCLVPHVMSAKMLGNADFARYPTVRRIFETCLELDAFSSTQPARQPDAPGAAQS
jgi:maleylacetoacetate isomerase